MEENQEDLVEETSKRNRSLPLFIVLFLVSLGLNLFLFFKYAKNGAQIQEQNLELAQLYKVANFKADSLQQELDLAIQQLQDKINENLAQEDLKESIRFELEEQKQSLINAQAKISRLIANGNSTGSASSDKALLAARTEIDELKKTNNEYIEQAEEAQKKYASAKKEAEKNGLAAETYKVENDSLIEVTSTLNNKLKAASDLNIAGLVVQAVRERKGSQEVTDRASKTERLQINFSVLGSELTQKESKELVIRIVEPNGAVLTKNTTELTNSDELHTMLTSLDYDGTEKGVTYYYKHDAAYKKGVFKIEIYNNKRLLDRKTFSLR
jgi:hypothetical protein